jgi:uncharacterized membrane protein (DUF106 family)
MLNKYIRRIKQAMFWLNIVLFFAFTTCAYKFITQGFAPQERKETIQEMLVRLQNRIPEFPKEEQTEDSIKLSDTQTQQVQECLDKLANSLNDLE